MTSVSTFLEQAWAGLGALIGLLLVGIIGRLALGNGSELPFLIAPMGAAAVLLFAVPHSPLAKAWPVIGGNTLSALVGVCCANLIADPLFAASIACGLSIALMMMAGCLHPPGGAVSLTAVLGGPSVQSIGFGFAIWPVAISALVLFATAALFSRGRQRLQRLCPA